MNYNKKIFKECSITLYNNSMEGVYINEDGISNIAIEGLRRYENIINNRLENKKNLKRLLKKIKEVGQSKEYDCLIGLSGGVDSSILAVRCIELGLRPLAVHLDNGWNTNTSNINIENIVKKLNIDLITKIIPWNEVKDLQRAYIKASVLDIECITDHAINSILFKMASKYKIKYILNGSNIQTENYYPENWSYIKLDAVNIIDIHEKYGNKKLKDYPIIKKRELIKYLFFDRIKSIPLLNYINYNKEKAIEELKLDYSYQTYKRKHGENRFTKFYQEIYLPKKFLIDKRVSHLSSLIISGEIDKNKAISEINKPLYTDKEFSEEIEYVSKKLGFKSKELIYYLNVKPKSHLKFKNNYGIFKNSILIKEIVRPFSQNVLTKEVIQKYFYK